MPATSAWRTTLSGSRATPWPATGGASDFQESYLRFVLGFLAITDLEVVRAQGIAYSQQHREQAIAGALAALPQPHRLAKAA